jgi:hypothetical protein
MVFILSFSTAYFAVKSLVKYISPSPSHTKEQRHDAHRHRHETGTNRQRSPAPNLAIRPAHNMQTVRDET